MLRGLGSLQQLLGREVGRPHPVARQEPVPPEPVANAVNDAHGSRAGEGDAGQAPAPSPVDDGGCPVCGRPLPEHARAIEVHIGEHWGGGGDFHRPVVGHGAGAGCLHELRRRRRPARRVPPRPQTNACCARPRNGAGHRGASRSLPAQRNSAGGPGIRMPAAALKRWRCPEPRPPQVGPARGQSPL